MDADKLIELLIRFKRTISGPGRDFEIANILGRIINHFQRHATVMEAGAKVNSTMLNLDLELFNLLSPLDLNAIDERVAERVREA